MVSGSRFNRCMIGATVLVALSGWVARAQQPKDRVGTKIFHSRRDVHKALGKHVAEQIPAAFSFDLHSLVWVDLSTDKAPGLQIETLPADRPLRMDLSDALKIEAHRETAALIFTLRSDNPCMGGIEEPQDVIERCHKALARSVALAKKTLHLFATPRQRLKRVEVRRRQMPPRP